MIDKLIFFFLISSISIIVLLFGFWLNRDAYIRILKRETSILNKISVLFGLLLLLVLVAAIYSFIPAKYELALPFVWFDHFLINETGLYILKFSLMWYIIVIFQYYTGKKEIPYLKGNEVIDIYIKRTYLRNFIVGFIAVFLGFFVTLTSFISLVLLVLAMIICVSILFSSYFSLK